MQIVNHNIKPSPSKLQYVHLTSLKIALLMCEIHQKLSLPSIHFKLLLQHLVAYRKTWFGVAHL